MHTATHYIMKRDRNATSDTWQYIFKVSREWGPRKEEVNAFLSQGSGPSFLVGGWKE